MGPPLLWVPRTAPFAPTTTGPPTLTDELVLQFPAIASICVPELPPTLNECAKAPPATATV